jgi:NodT family efflux transporter outer membrane factor (OMF) lipoprotein
MLAAAILTSGCTSLKDYVNNGFKVGPSYGQPEACTAKHWLDAADVRMREGEEPINRWWTVFNDPTLDHLIQCAVEQNLSLREAGFRVLEARALLQIAQGTFFPQSQYMFGAYDRVVASAAATGFPEFGAQYYNLVNYGFNLTWELDFWGRYRRAIAAADATLDASVAGYEDVMVTLLGDVATNYVTVRTLQKRIQYAQENIDLERKIVGIAEKRRRGGQIGRLDLAQTNSVLDQTESQIPQLQIDLRQACNRLCVLLGTPPYDLQQQLGTGDIPIAPQQVAVGIPVDLLRRRPDVRRAERLAVAQGEQIGIAEADLYPRFALTGTLGWEAQDLSHLFTAPAFNSSVGPAFQWNILNYGRLSNNVKLQEAHYQELVTTFRDSVLQANAEAENALTAFLWSHERARALDQSVVHSKEANDILLDQYNAGAVDITRLMLVMQTLVQQRDLQATAHGQIAQGLVQVYRALGGGWTPPAAPPAAATAAAPAAQGVAPVESQPAEAQPAEPPLERLPPPPAVPK